MIRSLAGRADVVEVGLHQRLAGDARRGRRQRQPQVLHVEAGSQPERAHEHRLAHSMDLAQRRPVCVGGNDSLAVDLGMQDLVDDPVDASDGRARRPPSRAEPARTEERDPAAGQMGFVERERVDGAGRQRQLVERKAPERAADVLLAVAPHQLGDLRAETRVNLGVALGVVGQEVDGRELDRLQERAGLPARSIATHAAPRGPSGDPPVRPRGPVPAPSAARTSRARAARLRPGRS